MKQDTQQTPPRYPARSEFQRRETGQPIEPPRPDRTRTVTEDAPVMEWCLIAGLVLIALAVVCKLIVHAMKG